MTEDQVFAVIGRKQIQLETLQVSHDTILEKFAQLLSGEMAPSQFLVNLTAKTLTWTPAGQTPSMPATINGEPRCVVGKPHAVAATLAELAQSGGKVEDVKEPGEIEVRIPAQP